MVDMNYDHILEVPDTPDRIQQSTCPVSSPAASRGIRKAAGNPLPPRRIIFKTRSNSINVQSSKGSASGALPTNLDSGDIFKQAELARLLPVAEDLEAKSGRTTGTSVDNGNRPEKLALDQSSNISNNTSYRGIGGRSHSCQIREGVSRRDANRLNADFLGVGSGLPTITTGKPCRTGTGMSNKLKAVAGAEVCSGSSPRVDEGETVIKRNKTGLSGPTPCVVPQRHVAQRKLVRNGCISPSNIAKRSVKVDGRREPCSTSGHLHQPNAQVNVFEKGHVIDLTDNSPTITRQGGTVNNGPISVNNMKSRAERTLIAANAGKMAIPAANQVGNSIFSESSNNKGKEIFQDVMGTKQSGEATMRRVSPRAGGDSYPAANNDITCMSSEQGWRTTHTNTSKPLSLLGKMASSCGRESESSGPSNQDHETAAGDKNNETTTIQPASLGNKISISRRKRKYTSNSYHPGESSSSLDEPRGSCHASSNSTAARNHTSRCHDVPVINIDDVCSPEVRPGLSGSGSSSGTSVDRNVKEQLESDELLARQLQEQLYNETPRVVPTEEIDAIVAMSLQNEEDAQRTSGTVSRYQNNTTRARTIRREEDAQFVAAVRRFESSTNAARAFHSHISQHATRPGYDLRGRTVYQRVVLSRYAGAHIQPNIDLNDYDALLALDENNHQHVGASESQINNLPQSVVQLNSTEDPCAVCLENPSIGETIRHLPCFHKFHKECIDEWLRRKKQCPVCKCGITS